MKGGCLVNNAWILPRSGKSVKRCSLESYIVEYSIEESSNGKVTPLYK